MPEIKKYSTMYPMTYTFIVKIFGHIGNEKDVQYIKIT